MIQLSLAAIASRVSKSLKRKNNGRAVVNGSWVTIQFIHQRPHSIRKPQALEYAAWLEAGNAGSYETFAAGYPKIGVTVNVPVPHGFSPKAKRQNR